MVRGLLRAAAFIFCAGGWATAQEPSPRVVRLDEALKAADLIPDLKVAEAAMRVAEFGVQAAGRWPDPSFTFATRSITAKESYALSAPLPWPGRGARLAVAKAAAEIAGTERQAARLMGRRAMRLAWFTLAAREDLAAAALERASRMRKTAEAVAALYDAGRIALVESSRGRVDAAIANAEQTKAEEERRIAESVLRRLLGIEDATRIKVERPTPLFDVGTSLDMALSGALTRSPAAKAAEAQLKAAEASLRLASALRFPGISVELGADRNDPTQPGTDRSIGVNLTVPLGSGPALAIARAERDRAIALREQVKREAKDAVEGAWRTAWAERIRYEALRDEALPAAMQAADLAQIAYHEGRFDIFRLLDAERALAETRSGLAEAYLAWGVAYAELLSAMGEEGE